MDGLLCGVVQNMKADERLVVVIVTAAHVNIQAREGGVDVRKLLAAHPFDWISPDAFDCSYFQLSAL